MALPSASTNLWHVQEYSTEFTEGEWVKRLAVDSIVNKDGIELYIHSVWT